MSLSAAYSIGRTALFASQIGVQTTGNNMANAATPGYSRQLVGLRPLGGDSGGVAGSIGRGVQVASVQRQVDAALQSRLWNSTSDNAAANAQYNILSQMEAVLGELSDEDLSSELSAFFSAWSERANQTRSAAAVVQQGDKLAGFIRRVRTDLADQQRQIDGQLGGAVERANQLLSQVADLNSAISQSEGGGASANTLRDQRDQALTELAGLIDITVVDHGQGGVDVLVGSSPVLQGGTSLGLELRRTQVDGSVQVSVGTRTPQTQLTVTSGVVGGLLSGRLGAIGETVERLDTLTSSIIFEVNRLHSTGRNATNLTSITGSLAFPLSDRTRPLNDPANQTITDLPFRPSNGGFTVHVRNPATGTESTVRIDVDLDGITSTGAPGTADDTSAEDIRAALSAIPGLSASFAPGGGLRIEAQSGFEFSFSEDSSGVLAVLGVNSYFTGKDASTIGVRQELKSDPALLMSGGMVNGQFVENAAALSIANLRDRPIALLNGTTIAGHWQDTTQAVGNSVSAAGTAATASEVVKNSLEAQKAAISGVSLDEEAINLLAYQRQYQGAARLIQVADELMQTLINLV